MSRPPSGSGSGPARTSVETLRAIADGTGRTSAIATTFGLRLDDIEHGRVGARMPAHLECGSGLGSALILADLTLGSAISSTTPDAGVQTLRMHASTAGPRTTDTEMLRGASRLDATSEGSATSSGEVIADDGRALITMSCRCAVRGSAPPGTGGAHAPYSEDAPAGDPWDLLALCVDHTAPVPELHAAGSLSNLSGVVQGGLIAAVLAHAAEDDLDMDPGAALDVDVAYLRGVPADGSRLPIVVEGVHRGRRYGVARATLLDRNGRPAVTATVGAWAT